MKKTIIATTVAALLASSALPAISQDANVGVDAGAGVSVDTPSLDAEAGTDTGADAGVDSGTKANASSTTGVNANANANANANDMADDTYGSVMSSIKASADLDLTSITDESKVSIVLISSLKGNAETESAALDNELTANADAQAGLHTRIEDNATIKAKLEAEGHAVEDVVSIKTKADGSVIVYVDDRD
ncbi:hypothetical protein [Devosia sp. CAU 1758]